MFPPSCIHPLKARLASLSLAGALLAFSPLTATATVNDVIAKAGPNGKELEKVLAHYIDDSLKHRAACFLIENMDAHFHRSSPAISNYYREMDSIFSLPKQKDDAYKDAYLDISTKNGDLSRGSVLVWDHLSLTSTQIISQIDEAFEMWQKPWNKELSFEQFCEYVLPYRVASEPVSEWRREYISTYRDRVKFLFDAQPNHTLRFGMYNALNRGFYGALYYPSTFLPDMPLELLRRMRIGNCESNTVRNIAQLRAFGIPAAIDFTPQWGNFAMGHSWGVLLEDNDKFIPFGLNEPLGIHFTARPNHKLPKVYRHTFKKQAAQEAFCADTTSITPTTLHNPCIEDVTDKYTETSSVTVSVGKSEKFIGNPWVYLCVFDNQEWTPVCVAKRDGETAHFEKVGRGIVYLPMAINKFGDKIAVGPPFILQADAQTNELTAHQQPTQKVRAVRKYTYLQELKEYANQTVGGKFQVANKEDFSDSITIATIEPFKESRFQSIKPTTKGAYRYFRYLSPKGSFGNMAEVEIYGKDGKKLQAAQTFGTRGAVKGHNLEMLFDGDALTSYSLPFADGGWAAMELATPTPIGEVRFLPRNDGNHIEEGDTYQLYYWTDGDWQLLSQQRGNHEGVLFFEDCPTNALFLLHDDTKGIQERIFTYEDGEQVWW